MGSPVRVLVPGGFLDTFATLGQVASSDQLAGIGLLRACLWGLILGAAVMFIAVRNFAEGALVMFQREVRPLSVDSEFVLFLVKTAVLIAGVYLLLVGFLGNWISYMRTFV